MSPLEILNQELNVINSQIATVQAKLATAKFLQRPGLNQQIRQLNRQKDDVYKKIKQLGKQDVYNTALEQGIDPWASQFGGVANLIGAVGSAAGNTFGGIGNMMLQNQQGQSMVIDAEDNQPSGFGSQNGLIVGIVALVLIIVLGKK